MIDDSLPHGTRVIFDDSWVAASTDQPQASATRATEHSSFLENQDEGVLMDVLHELDKERSQRAELQARIRILEQQVQSSPRPNLAAVNPNSIGSIISSTTPSNHDYLALKAERDGYLQLVEALTHDRPAFSKQQRLPLHAVRLLELVPWDPRARQHLFGEETLWEWQILGANKTWQAKLRHFPTIFKTLPIVVPRQGQTVGEAPTSSSPPKHCVLTNLQITQILKIDKGYPLPQDGGDWVWVGGWRIEKHSEADAEGWSYSNDLDLTVDSSYYDEFRPPQRGTPNLVKRRRKWTRSRVLVDYPHASAMTKEYLKLVAEKANLDLSVIKLSSQLVETKMKLTTLEADYLTLEGESNQKVVKLERELEEKNKLLEMMQQHDGLDTNTGANLPVKKDQMKDKLRSAMTALVGGTVSKRQGSGTSSSGGDMVEAEALNGGDAISISDHPAAAGVPLRVPSKDSSDVTQIVFDSLKGKGTDFFEKMKRKRGEELEKLKKQNQGFAPWKVSSLTKKSSTDESEQAAPVHESIGEESLITDA